MPLAAQEAARDLSATLQELNGSREQLKDARDRLHSTFDELRRTSAKYEATKWVARAGAAARSRGRAAGAV